MPQDRGSTHVVEPSEFAVPGAYVTDELRLFRVLARRTISGQTFIQLEDCLTFGVWQLSLGQVARLRPVREPDGDPRVEAVPVGS